MSNRIATFTLLVPGPWSDAAPVVSALQNAGITARAYAPGLAIDRGAVVVEIIEDDELAAALTYGRRGRLPAALLARIAQTNKAAVVEIALQPLEDHAAIASIGKALRDAGGLAVRMELSGGAATWETWIAAFESGSIVDIYEASVIFVSDGETTFTCGMHHFDRPDATISGLDPRVAIDWLDALHTFELFESPALASGHTFAPDANTPRRVIERWPDANHGARDSRYNPLGVWRACDPSVPPRSVPRAIPTIIPALVVLLTARENQLKRPLTRTEVEEITSSCPAVALPLDQVIAMERSRGYADIDPHHAWAQWQLVVAAR